MLPINKRIAAARKAARTRQRMKKARDMPTEPKRCHHCGSVLMQLYDIGPLRKALSVHQANWHLDQMEKARTATIERCAQWLKDEFSRRGLDGPESDAIVTAIRAMKTEWRRCDRPTF